MPLPVTSLPGDTATRKVAGGVAGPGTARWDGERGDALRVSGDPISGCCERGEGGRRAGCCCVRPRDAERDAGTNWDAGLPGGLGELWCPCGGSDALWSPWLSPPRGLWWPWFWWESRASCSPPCSGDLTLWVLAELAPEAPWGWDWHCFGPQRSTPRLVPPTPCHLGLARMHGVTLRGWDTDSQIHQPNVRVGWGWGGTRTRALRGRGAGGMHSTCVSHRPAACQRGDAGGPRAGAAGCSHAPRPRARLGG